MATPPTTAEFESIRHGLKNNLTALRHGCTLIESKLGDQVDEEIALFLNEMRASIQSASDYIVRLRQLELSLNEPKP